MNQNNGSLGINADGCAGCHRIHTAQGPLLLKAGTDETGLCLSCHGAAVTGATTDVMTGVQYQLASGARSGTQLGALRSGGYDQARIGDPTRLTYSSSRGPSGKGKVAADVSNPTDVTSAHLDLDGSGGVVAKNIAWGNGDNGTGAGPTVALTCVACHNPHGNGQYRILRPVPELDGAEEITAIAYDIIATDADTDRVYLSSTAPILPADKVTIAGNASVNGTWLVDNSITNGNGGTWIKLRTVDTNVLLDITSSATGGTLTRVAGMTVTDAAVPGANDVRNYTVIQSTSTPLLYASNILTGNKSKTDVVKIASSDAATDVITTAAAHGFAAGNTVVIVSHDAVVSIAGVAIASMNTTTEEITTSADHHLAVGDITKITGVTGATPSLSNYSCTVSTIVSTTVFKCSGLNISVAGTGGTVAKTINGAFKVLAAPTTTTFTLEDPESLGNAVNITTGGVSVAPGPYGWATRSYTVTTLAPTDGDYFHRYGNWYDAAGYDNPVGTQGANTNSTSPSSTALFDDQITQWCSSCHTRYYAWQNPELQTTITADAGTNVITTAAPHGLVVNGQIAISGSDSATLNGTWYVKTVVDATHITISATSSNSVPGPEFDITPSATTGVLTQWGPSYDVEREGDATYKFQHRTRDNRACTTCHVAHGSNAQMTGTFSSTVNYPDGSISASSRLLKVDNRGTCQLCHDPTSTQQLGWFIGVPFATSQ